MMDEGRDKIMCAVFAWAYANDIEVTLTPRYEWGEKWPELHFRRGDRNAEIGFWLATDISAKLEHCWRGIAIDLCVEPLVLPEENYK